MQDTEAKPESDAIAYVRLRFDLEAKYRTEHGKAVKGPTGRTYYFDGPRDGDSSPWVPVYPQHREDLELFEEYDRFEVEHEEQEDEEPEPVGRVRWTGVADQSLRRTRKAKRSQAGFEFLTRLGEPSGWREVYDMADMEQFEEDSEFETEWYS